MPQSSCDAIVVSQRSLIRELLCELLRVRCGARSAGSCSTLDEALRRARGAKILLCDEHGFPADALTRFVASLRAEHPALRVACIDDSVGPPSIEEIVRASCGSAPPVGFPHEKLTPIELEVMLAVAAGLRNADIARRMRRSSKTVEKHRANALLKLGLRNVAQLTTYAIQYRLLDMDAILARRIP